MEFSSYHEDSAVDRVEVTGATLAFMLQEFGSAVGDCDGLLFGHLERRNVVNLQDDDAEPGTREELKIVVTGHCCTGRLFSFYDGTGQINHGKLKGLVGDRYKWGGDPLVGWLVGRRNTPPWPSMREAQVTANLRLTSKLNINSSASNEVERLSSPRSKLNISPSAGNEVERLASPRGNVDNKARDMQVHKDVAEGIVVMGKDFGSPSKLGLPYSVSDSGSPTQSSSCQEVGNAHSTKKGSPAKGSPSRGSPSKSNKRASSSTALQETKGFGLPLTCPCIFLLLSESVSSKAVQSHEYRAFQYHSKLHTFQPRTVVIRNLGHVSQIAKEEGRSFYGQYGSYSPVASLPWLSTVQDRDDDGMDSWRKRDDDRITGLSQHSSERRERDKEQALLNMYAEGYALGRLGNMVRADGPSGVLELEELYSKMLSKLQTLANDVSNSSAAVHMQEAHNAKLRAAAMDRRL